MEILYNSQVKIDEWKEFLAASDLSSPFQTPEFYNLYNSIPGQSAEVFAISETKKIVALCVVTLQKERGMKGFFSRRAIIYGGPVVNGNTDALVFLLKSIAGKVTNVIYLETRNLNSYSVYKNEFENSGWRYQPYLNFQLKCSNEETIWENLNTNRQRQVKKALKEGVMLEEAKTLSDVKEFYSILSHLYKTKIRKPLLPLEFFEKFISSGVGKILLVKKENKIIGGIAAPILEGRCICEFYICGLDYDYKECSPSVMATYAAIQYGNKNDLKYFDFMGAGKPESDYNVRDFKEKFGGELVEHGRFIKINNQFLYYLGKMAIHFMSGKKRTA